MFDIATITTTATIVLGILTWAVLTRILGDADPAEVITMFGPSWEPDWPRGVQEEEPFHWRLDRISRVAPADAGQEPRPLRVAPAEDEGAEDEAA